MKILCQKGMMILLVIEPISFRAQAILSSIGYCGGRISISTFILVVLIASMLLRPAYSATFSFDDSAIADAEPGTVNPKCSVTIGGLIEKGDLEKIRAEFEAHRISGGLFATDTVCLNSPGGDFKVGLDIAKFILDSDLPTQIPAGASCESACAWIFMSGTWRIKGRNGVVRTMSPNASLKFHAPYVDLTSEIGRNFDWHDLQRAYNEAVAELGGRLLALTEYSASYPDGDYKPVLPVSLIAESLAKMGEEKLVIATVGQAVKWNIAIEGEGDIVPGDQNDVANACRYAWAQKFGRWQEYVFGSEMKDYIAFYGGKDPKILTAEVILEGLGSGDCEVNITLNDTDDAVGTIEVYIPSRIHLSTAYVRYQLGPPQRFNFGPLSFLPWATPLSKIDTVSHKGKSVADLVTLGRPKWCDSMSIMGADERTICSSGRLSAFDVLLSNHYRRILARLDPAARDSLQSEQKAWLLERSKCESNIPCLEKIYANQIDQFLLDVDHPP
jgi:hypothetical protein